MARALLKGDEMRKILTETGEFAMLVLVLAIIVGTILSLDCFIPSLALDSTGTGYPAYTEEGR
jgi:hypothetical protein